MKKDITITPRNPNKLTPAYLWSKVQAYCKLYGIRRNELAEIVGKTEATISNYNRSPENVTLEVIYKFCRTYHIGSISELEDF